MLSAEKREKYRRMWIETFDSIYENAESFISDEDEILIVNKSSLRAYDIHGKEHAMKPVAEE